ncbi:PREDICTED: cilia- and flagella-associated protein 70 [Trachymyrmex cornetzi]|uniref:cilia- and flagella-associated protein 70 n=1 Tax=Trachymyrmex cornetzi TaxID=471704 RepID=UPI00084F6B08|nr:PREDICTED: cilia- and flagella-associated protein 70 [Trachymyrmex cornetzi]
MEESLIQDEPIKRSIKIVIDSIENITVKEETGISFTVIHNDVVLGESTPLIIDPGFKEPPQVYDVNFGIEFLFIVNDRNNMNSIVSTPILIKVTSDVQDQHVPNSDRSVTESKQKITAIVPQQISTSSSVIGFCTLDLMPILLGEKLLVERLIVQTPYLSFDGNAISWQNLPLLNATVIYNGEEIFSSQTKINFLSVTVESIYNPPIFFTEDADYKAGTIIYIDNELPENVIFENGEWKKYRDLERTKRWRSLSKLQSRARLSKWKLDYDYAHIKNMLDVELDLQKKVCQDEPRIEWNFTNRSILRDVGSEMMKKHLVKYKYWPFQFMVSKKIVEKSNIIQNEEELSECQLFQCYVDLSELVFPGIKSTRVIAQLYTHDASSIAVKTGLEKDIFYTEPRGKNLKEQESKKTGIQITESSPLISETGEPVFVIIEVELFYPLVPCRLENEFSDVIEEMIKPKVTKSHYVYSLDLAEQQYATCIRKIVEIITESYRDFCDEKKREKSSVLKDQESDSEKVDETKCCFTPEEDELTCFTQYLYKTGTYLNVRSTLKLKVITLLDQKFKTNVNTVHSIDSQNFVASVYTYLVEQMHLAINKIVESRLKDNDLPSTVIPTKSFFYAEEAYELGHVDDARRHYQAAIAADRNDAEAWTKYAIFLLKISDAERAKECCREAILLNRRDKFALLTFGLILAKDHSYREAEIFLRAVTDFYPRFVEGWIILHLFYTRINYNPGIDFALRIAEGCVRNGNKETEITSKDPLAWTMIHCPRDNVFMITVTLLLKLHFCDFADLALEKEMSRAGRPTHVLYYLAVRCYLSQQYEEALSHLKEAKSIYGLDYSIGSLMGHCHFQKGNFADAIQCYEFANSMFNKPDDLHLVQTRMGLYYENAGDYERGLKIFLTACKILPTAETWLGAGIAFFELQRFTEAEMALSEANQIDNRNMTVWKYLCLLNMSLQRDDEFAQCYEQIAQCTLVILCLLDVAIFTTISCNESSSAMRHSVLKKDDVPRIKIRVFRGPTQEENDEYFATWGYWIQQPSR